MNSHTASLLDAIERRYNAEFDTHPGGPEVHWATMNLVLATRELDREVQELKRQVEDLRRRLEDVKQI